MTSRAASPRLGWARSAGFAMQRLAGAALAPDCSDGPAFRKRNAPYFATGRDSLRRAAQAEMARRTLWLHFEEPLESLYAVDQAPGRVRALHQIVRLGVAVYVSVVLAMNLLVDANHSMLALPLQLCFAPGMALLLAHRYFRTDVSAFARETAVTVSCCCYSLAAMVTVYFSPSDIILIDLTVVTLPVIGVLFFARQPFASSVIFTAFSVIGLALLLLALPDLPTGPRLYPMVFMVAAAVPALVGVYRLEQSARNVWLLRLLQSLQIDDLACANAELAAQAEAMRQAGEERLRQAHKMEAVGQLTGGVAHDFNNLLTTVLGSLELLQQRGGLDEGHQKLVRQALAGAERGAHLTGQLLGFARQQPLAPSSFQPASVIAGVSDLLERTVSARTVLAIAPAPPDGWTVLADRNQLEMALLNLVINARDAIGEATDGLVDIECVQITMRPGASHVGDIEGDRLRPGDYVGIRVRDNGAGMPADVLARACEPFFTTKAHGAGSGLGLAQIHAFARQSGGTVWLRSTPGVGTQITIVLPRGQSLPQAEIPSQNTTRTGAGETILLVEDDLLARDTITESLQALGYQVLSAENAEAALVILRGLQSVQLLLTDIALPGAMNGVALAHAARRARPGLKIMFSTGFNDIGSLDAWPEKLHLLRKPFGQRSLASHIAACLDD